MEVDNNQILHIPMTVLLELFALGETELTMPNIISGSGGGNIKGFFRMSSSYELRKRIGREMQSIGTLETNMLFNLIHVVRK